MNKLLKMEIKNHMSHRVDWAEIENKIDKLMNVNGGFTSARRGLLKMDDGTTVFVKQGIDEQTKSWAKKEINLYEFLAKNHYKHIPQILSIAPDQSGFALEALLPKDGWIWQEKWTLDRAEKTLEAMDELSTITPSNAQETNLLTQETINESRGGWDKFILSSEAFKKLQQRIKQFNFPQFINEDDIKAEAKRLAPFRFVNSHLVHNDIRADNCPWNTQTKTVCLIDWNWAQLGDRRIDVAATIIDMSLSGLDISPFYKRLDPMAVSWLVGYWLIHSIREDNEPLRKFQTESGFRAFKLLEKI